MLLADGVGQEDAALQIGVNRGFHHYVKGNLEFRRRLDALAKLIATRKEMLDAGLHTFQQHVVLDQPQGTQRVLVVKPTLLGQQVFQQGQAIKLVLEPMFQREAGGADAGKDFQALCRGPQNGATGVQVIQAATLGQ